MFKYVNCVSGSLNDLKEAYKKKLNVTLACRAGRIMLSVSECAELSPVPVGHPWLVQSAPFSISQKVTLGQRPCQLMALKCPSSTGWLSGWFMLLNDSLVLVRALEAEVIYLFTELSCIQQCSVWPCKRKHTSLPARDSAVLGILVTSWHGHLPSRTGQRPLMLLPSTCGSQAELRGCLLVVSQNGWLMQPWATAMLPAAKVPCGVAV